MTDKSRGGEPQAGLPRPDAGFDLDRALKSIVTVQSTIPEDAFTAETLGEQRSGSGVVIRESGLVLTIGYLITEAENVWLADADGRVTPGHALAVDPESGFGLVQALDRLDCPPLELGRSGETKVGDPVFVAAGAGTKPVRAAIVGKQEFAGYWEYFLDEAIFTAPAHPFWGGAGAIDRDGRLLGVGSLHVEQLTARGGPRDVNMIVPIDLLPPILDDLLTYGRVNKPARPWLGIYSAESGDEIVVASVAERGPAAEAGIRRGDILASVGGAEIVTWAISIARSGAAGRRASKSRSRSSATAGRSAYASGRPIGQASSSGRACSECERASLARPARVGDFVDEFAHHRVAEAVEIVDRHDESARPADHVVAVVLGDAAGRIGVQREIAAHRRGPRLKIVSPLMTAPASTAASRAAVAPTALVACSVARDVDHPAVGRERALGEQREGKVDRRPDRGPSDEGARRRGQRGSEGAVRRPALRMTVQSTTTFCSLSPAHST